MEDHKDVLIGWTTGTQQLTRQLVICSFGLFQYQKDIDILKKLQQKSSRQLQAGALALWGEPHGAGLVQTGKDTTLGGNCKLV